MTFRSYLALIAATTGLAWAGWVFVLWQVNPDEAGALGFALFYLTLGTALMGTIATASFAYRVLFLKREVLMREVRITVRHALLLGSGGILALVCAANEWLSWLTGILLIGVIGAIEYVCLVIDSGHRG